MKTLHEELFDPRLFKFQLKKEFNQKSKQAFSGNSPNLFVGRFGYPNIRVGLLSTQEEHNNDNPVLWSRQNTSIHEIVKLRSQLVNAGKQLHVKPSAEKILELGQEVAMAIKPVAMDVSLEEKPQFKLHFRDEALPFGPKASLTKASITSNPKIPTSVYKVVDDDDLKATNALGSLWSKGYSEHQLTKLLSSASLGVKQERKLVPTRWSITAVDDSVGKQLTKQILDYPEIDFLGHFGGFQGNYFFILFLPQEWSFELFENYVGTKAIPNKLYTDYESVRGRTTYAKSTAGGYYATRLPILEHLKGKKRQGGVLAIRFITDEYWAPLGVWVVREAVRKTLATKPLQFTDQQTALLHLKKLLKSKFSFDCTRLLGKSKLLAERRNQTKLSRFL